MRRPRLLAIGLCVLAIAWWRRDDAPPTSVGPLYTAVLRDGFAIMEAAGDRHVLELDREGARRRRSAIPVITDARVVGTRTGAAVGFLDEGRVKLGRVTDDGTLGGITAWGHKVDRLCDGAASNDLRFAIGWLERNGKLSYVHGPVTAELATTEVATTEHTTRATGWCAITSAGEDIAVFWREGTRLFMQTCSTRTCSMLVRIPLNPKQALVAQGCSSEGCLLAFRNETGKPQLGWMTLAGKPLWSKPLPQATSRTAFSITAIGARAMAVGFVSSEGATVLRVSNTGAMERAWADPASTEQPSVAWASGQLLVAIADGDTIRHDVVAAPAP
ncbi:MAG: hypothetical protein JWP01_1159 [Myxococcales bacterium]|nr:hypothetical protein [Myxococcales bacterium]